MLSLRTPNKHAWTILEQKHMEPLQYLQKVPSKHHMLMVSAFNHWLQVPEDKVEDIVEILQTVHSASLLIDDIQDESAFRYGVPATHSVFGVGLTLNSACITLLAAGKRIFELGHPLAPQIYLDRMLEIFDGQGIDLYWRDHLKCPSEEEHIDMIKKKVASFFNLEVELLQLFGTYQEDLTKLATNVAMYYCILDDYFNVFHPKALENLASKKQGSSDHMTCSDITECKFTLPVIHAMQFPDVTSELSNILKLRTTDPILKNHFISLLKKHGSDGYTRDLLRSLEANIRMEIKQQGGNATLTNLMDDLSGELNPDRRLTMNNEVI